MPHPTFTYPPVPPQHGAEPMSVPDSSDPQRLEAALYCTEDVNDASITDCSSMALAGNVAALAVGAAGGGVNTDGDNNFVLNASTAAARHFLSVPETMKVDAFVSSITSGSKVAARGVAAAAALPDSNSNSALLPNNGAAGAARSDITTITAPLAVVPTLISNSGEGMAAMPPSATPYYTTNEQEMGAIALPEPTPVFAFPAGVADVVKDQAKVTAASVLTHLMGAQPPSPQLQPQQQQYLGAVSHAHAAPARVSSPEHESLSSLECSSNSIASHDHISTSASSDADVVFAQLKARTSNARAVAAAETKKKRRSSSTSSASLTPENQSLESAIAANSTSQATAASSNSSHKKPRPANANSKSIAPNHSTRRSSTYLPCNAGKDRRWTTSEDNRLRRAVVFDHIKDWSQVCAEYFENERTPEQCQKRWQNVLSVGLVKGKWSQHEDQAIVDALLSGVKSWKQIAKSIPGRLSKQCRERWQNHLDPMLRNKGWSTEEDDVLKEAQAQWGNKWKVISMLYPGRSETSVKNRWNSARFRPMKQEGVTTNYLKFDVPIQQRIKTNAGELLFVTNARQAANDIEIKGVEYVLTEGHSDRIELTGGTREALLEAKAQPPSPPPQPRRSASSKKAVKPAVTNTAVPLAPADSLQDYHDSKPSNQPSPPVAESPPAASSPPLVNSPPPEVEYNKIIIAPVPVKEEKKEVEVKVQMTSRTPSPPLEVVEPTPVVYPGAPGTTTTTTTFTTASGQQQQVVVIQQACCACCCAHKQQHNTSALAAASAAVGGAQLLPQPLQGQVQTVTTGPVSGNTMQGIVSAIVADCAPSSAINIPLRDSHAETISTSSPTGVAAADGADADNNSNMDVLMKAIKMC